MGWFVSKLTRGLLGVIQKCKGSLIHFKGEGWGPNGTLKCNLKE